MSFLSLPPEVRLQIYSWLHLMTPVKHAQLAPWYPTPTYSAYFLKAVVPDVEVGREPYDVVESTSAAAFQAVESRETQDEEAGRHDSTKNRGQPQRRQRETPKLLSPYRPLSGLPTALLLSCRQVYEEARTIPFHANEFVFINWFSSGLWAARAFTKGLASWQRNELRHARLELLARDLVSNGSSTTNGLKEWRELCALWATGLQSLRLRILVGGGVFGVHFGDGEMPPAGGERALDIRDLSVAGRANLSSLAGGACDSSNTSGENRYKSSREWIDAGLRQLRALRTLEVELCVKEWSATRRLEWCATLEEAVNEGRLPGEPRVRVVCVEKITVPGAAARALQGKDVAA